MQGTTVIFNEEYIDELSRHRDNWQTKYEVEDMPDLKEAARQNLEKFEKKLDWALNFRDTVEFTQHMEVPQITMVKTLSGFEIPAKHLQTL